ncbi:MAG: DUF559 domain-containing protein [Pseudolysinimonas sp.]
MFQRRLPPESFFSHATAARLLDAPLPFRHELGPIHVSVPAPQRAPHAKGITGHSRQVLPGDVTESAGVRHSSAARVWCELARVLDLGDLVAVGDHLIHHRLPRVSVQALCDRVGVGDRISRSRTLHQALSLLDDHAESRPESRLRVILARGGFPAPLINHALVLTDSGTEVRPDFRFLQQRVILEYQGDYHRTRAQWRKDMTRRSRLEAAGWAVVELNADDLRDPIELCGRIRTIMWRRA